MSIETAIYGELTGDAAVSALVSSRVYPLVLPQEPSYPAVTYQRVSTQPIKARGSETYRRSRWQFDCYAKTYIGAAALAEAVEAAMTAYSNASSPRVSVVLAESRRDGFEDLILTDGDSGLYRASLDFFMWYEE